MRSKNDENDTQGLARPARRESIYSVALQLVREVMPLVDRLREVDADLARQTRRSAMSVAQRMAEGMHSRGGNRPAHYQGAAASAKETEASLELAVAAGYVHADDVRGVQRLCDRVSACMWVWVHRPRARR